MHPAKNGITTSMDALPTETQQILFNTPYLHNDISYHLSFVDNYLDGKYLSEGAAREWSTVVIVIVIFMT